MKTNKSILIILSCVLIVACSQKEKKDSSTVQGWNILSNNEQQAEMVMDTAVDYGVNHLQLSHQIIMNLRQAKNTKRAAQVNKLTEKAHEKGIEKVFVWDHSLYNLDYYPDKFKTGPDSLLNLDNPEFWRWVKDDYRNMLSKIPNIDGVILTFIETGAHVEDQYSQTLPTEEKKLAAMVDSLASVIINENNLELYVRTFVYNKGELSSMLKAINLIKNPSVRVMTKEAPHDFFLTHPVSKFVDKIKRPTIIEFDAAHEYNGQGIIASIYPETHLKRWNYYNKLPNVIGYVARTDRYNNTSIINNPAEINLFALSRAMKKSETEIDSVYYDFVKENYGQETTQFLVPAFKKSSQITRSIFYTLGLLTNSHSRLQYNNASAYQRHVSGKWMEHPVIKIEKGINRKFHYWKDVVNHLAPAWYKQKEGTQLARESPWVLQKGWLEPEELMNDEYLKYVLQEKHYGVKKAKEALDLVLKAKPFIKNKAQADTLQHIFERTLMTARLYEATAKLFFGYRVYARDDSFQTKYVREKLYEGMRDTKKIAQKMKGYPYQGPVGQYEWKEDIYRALSYYNTIKNRTENTFHRNFFTSFPYSGLTQDVRKKIWEEAFSGSSYKF